MEGVENHSATALDNLPDSVSRFFQLDVFDTSSWPRTEDILARAEGQESRDEKIADARPSRDIS
jgi:hypothetical protein